MNEKKIYYKNIPKDLGNNLNEKIKLFKEVINNIKKYKNLSSVKLYKKKIIHCSTIYGNFGILSPNKNIKNNNCNSRRMFSEIFDNSNKINRSRSPIIAINLQKTLNTEINNSNLINPKDLIDFYYKVNNIILLPLDENKIRLNVLKFGIIIIIAHFIKILKKYLQKKKVIYMLNFLLKIFSYLS
jgi:hypothetical protein